MNFKQIGWESVDRIVQADDRGQCPFLWTRQWNKFRVVLDVMLCSPLQVSGSCEMLIPLKLHGIMSHKRVIFLFNDQGNSKNLIFIKLHDHNVREILTKSPASSDFSLCISEVPSFLTSAIAPMGRTMLHPTLHGNVVLNTVVSNWDIGYCSYVHEGTKTRSLQFWVKHTVLSQPVHGTATYRCDDTRCCIIQFWPPDDEHIVLETCKTYNKSYYKTRICVLSWLITKIVNDIWSGLWAGNGEMQFRVGHPLTLCALWRSVLLPGASSGAQCVGCVTVRVACERPLLTRC